MKLRIKGNSIRLRLTKTEVEQFDKEGKVQESVQFGPEHFFYYQIVSHPDLRELNLVYEDHTMRVEVPAALAEEWTKTSQIGFEQEINSGSSHIHLLVEKDFQCLHRDNAEEPDNYAHPLAHQKNDTVI